MENTKSWLASLGAVIDAKDAQGFANYMTEDGIFRFGNLPDVTGRDNVRDYVANFFTMIHASKHSVVDCWKRDDSLVWQGKVEYTRLDQKKVTVDFTNIFRMKGSLIHEYLIYIDNTPLWQN